jgi:hypothetical protein
MDGGQYMATASRNAPRTAAGHADTRRTEDAKGPTSARRTAATSRQTAAANAWRQTADAKQAEQRQHSRMPVARARAFAEKAVLVPVGAALIARDGLMAKIDELSSTYSTRHKTEQQLRRFERRGTRALKRLERDVKSAAAKASEHITALA